MYYEINLLNDEFYIVAFIFILIDIAQLPNTFNTSFEVIFQPQTNPLL
jgi:hypothetical protein